MDREIDRFLSVHIPSKGYHVQNGQVEVFHEKELSFTCVCRKGHKVKGSIVIIDFPIENKAIYICPENERLDIIGKLELQKKRG